MMYTELRKGQSVEIAGATVTVVKNMRNKVRLSIEADKSIQIKHGPKDGRVKQAKHEA